MDDKLIMTGYTGLDKVLGGLRPGSLNVIAARPGIGKSALARNIVTNVASNSGKAVVYYSLETSHVELAFEDLPIYIDDRCDLTPELLKERYEKLLADKTDVGLVIIDYLQLIACNDKSFDRFPNSYDDPDPRIKKTAVIINAIKEFAVEYQVPVIVVSQVSRAADYRKDHIPDIQDIRGISVIEQVVDSIVFINRSSYCSSESFITKQCTDAKLIVALNRFGERDVVIPVKWNPETLSFSDL